MDLTVVILNIAAKANPSHCIVMYKEGAGVDSVAKKVGAVIARIRVEHHAIRKGMESSGGKTLFIDV